MDVSNLWTLQCMMFLLAAAGAVLKKAGILKEDGKSVLTDMVLFFFLPCNIMGSFQMDFDLQVLYRFTLVLGISVLVQIFSFILSKALYNKKEESKKRVLQYCAIVSNSGFLGLPIAREVFGAEGMMYASIFIIPMRIMMWSAGIACFTESPDLKSVIKKIALHPCIVAVYIGLFLMVLERPLSVQYETLLKALGPAVGAGLRTLVFAGKKAVQTAGGCTTALTMLLIGMMMADVNVRDIINREAIGISFVRLFLLPFMVFVGCVIFQVDPFLAGVCVLITGMPAGSTSAILANKYGCDYVFATTCVVVSTLLSMASIPLWCMAYSAL